jgi:hypothetical protein
MRLSKVKAQASLEYMLVFAAAISFLLVFVVAGSNLTEAGVLFLEAKNAEKFMNSFELDLQEVSVFSRGTTKEISFFSGLEFELNAVNNKVTMILFGKEKAKSIDFDSKVKVSDFSFRGNKLILKLTNEGESISVKNS